MAAAPPAHPFPDEIRRVAALQDPVIRNLQITQCYHELAVAARGALGEGANWCALATWASKQAGQSIRKEDLVRSFEQLLESWAAAPPPGIAGAAGPDIGASLAALRDAISPSAAFDRSSEAVAEGNRKVFVEIGYEFARFLSLLGSGAPDDDRLQDFIEGLNPGDPPEGQRYLRQAFRHYVRAIEAETARSQAEWMLLANLEIGWHEQVRLQPEILGALEAPFYDPKVLRQRLLEALLPDPRARARLVLAVWLGRAHPVLAARDKLTEHLQQIGRRAITGHLMCLRLGGEPLLRLGQDLRHQFPDLLRHVANPELQALLAQIDPTPDSVYGTGAEDWGRLADRMHFIGDLFRAYHFEPVLFEPPYTAAQVAVLKQGGRPAGRL